MTGPYAGEFLSRLTETEAAALLGRGRRQVWPQGATLFTEGERSERVVIVLAGRVKVSCYTVDGREMVLAFRGPGALLGEMSAIDGDPLSATVTAAERVEAIVVPVTGFKDFLGSHAGAGYALLELIVRRLRDADRKRIEFGTQDTLGRVAGRLVELAERFGEPSDHGVRIGLQFTQDELAGWTGSSREAVAKALRALRERGHVLTRRRTMFITDIDALRRRAR